MILNKSETHKNNKNRTYGGNPSRQEKEGVKILTLESLKKEIRKLAQTVEQERSEKTEDSSDTDASEVIQQDLQDVRDFVFDITSAMNQELGIDYDTIYDLMLTADRIYGCYSLGRLRGISLVDFTISGYYVESIHSLEHRFEEMMLDRIERDMKKEGKWVIYLNTKDADRYARYGFVSMRREEVIWKLWSFFGIKHNYWSGIMDGGLTTLMFKKIKLLPKHRQRRNTKRNRHRVDLETRSSVGQVQTISLDRYKQALQWLSPRVSISKKIATRQDINTTILSDLHFIEKRKQEINRVPFLKLCRESLFIHSLIFISCDKIYACFSGHLRGIALVNETNSGYYVNYICSSGYRCGQQIFAKIEKDAKESGKRFIYLEAVPDAVNWYKKQGFTITNKDFSRLSLMDTLMHRELAT